MCWSPLRHSAKYTQNNPPPQSAHTSTLYNCNRGHSRMKKPPPIPSPAHQAIAQALNIIKIEMLFLGHRTVHKVGNYSLGQLGSAWASTVQNVWYFAIFFLFIESISGFFFQDKKFSKKQVFPAQEIHVGILIQNPVTDPHRQHLYEMHWCSAEVKKRRELAEKLPLTHIWDGGSGRGCVARQCCTHAQKICQKNKQK